MANSDHDKTAPAQSDNPPSEPKVQKTATPDAPPHESTSSWFTSPPSQTTGVVKITLVLYLALLAYGLWNILTGEDLVLSGILAVAAAYYSAKALNTLRARQKS